jgi:hypothetical protein
MAFFSPTTKEKKTLNEIHELRYIFIVVYSKSN